MSTILLIGTSHKYSPVDIRERIAFAEDELSDALQQLRPDLAQEAVIVSTCNRTELYLVPARKFEPGQLLDWLNRYKSVDMPASYLFTLHNFDAVRHLFDVVSGIDSQVIGDIQITGQVREAYQIAQSAGSAGKVLSRLFDNALRCAKRVKNETDVFTGAVSLSYVAVELARKIFHPLSGKRALVVGAGETGELTARNLHAQGVRQITIANRTALNTQALIERVGFGTPMALTDLASELHGFDIVIVCTGAQDYVITYKMARAATARRGGETQLIVDLSVPRNVEPSIGDISSIFCKDLNDLTSVIASNVERRSADMPKAESIITEELTRFASWHSTLPVTPVIAQLKRQGEQIMRIELEKNRNRFQPAEFIHVEKLVGSVVKKILGIPMAHLLNVDDGTEELARKAAYVIKMFNLDRDADAESATDHHTRIEEPEAGDDE